MDLGKRIVGFGLNGIGLFWSIFDRFLCGTFCGSECSVAQSETCSFIFLFVGIIFIVCGYALIIIKEKGRKKLATKIKYALKIANKR